MIENLGLISFLTEVCINYGKPAHLLLNMAFQDVVVFVTSQDIHSLLPPWAPERGGAFEGGGLRVESEKYERRLPLWDLLRHPTGWGGGRPQWRTNHIWEHSGTASNHRMYNISQCLTLML